MPYGRKRLLKRKQINKKTLPCGPFVMEVSVKTFFKQQMIKSLSASTALSQEASGKQLPLLPHNLWKYGLGITFYYSY